MFQLQLPTGDAALHLQHADQELTLECIDSNTWKLNVIDTSELPLTEGESKGLITTLSNKECAALLFLWGNCDEENEESIVAAMYETLKEFLASCPLNLRPIA